MTDEIEWPALPAPHARGQAAAVTVARAGANPPTRAGLNCIETAAEDAPAVELTGAELDSMWKEAMKTHDPFAPSSGIESFEVISESFEDGQVLPEAQRSAVLGAGGRDESPQLTWSGAPEGTRSYAVTVFDPDAPGRGYWHWAVVNIPADVTSLSAGAGSRGNSRLPSGAVQLKNDAGFVGFVGAAPPPGHGQHRYLLVVHAMDVERLDLRTDDTPAALQSALSTHTLGRARLTGTFERR